MLWGKYKIQPGKFNILGVVLGATRKTFWKTFLEDLSGRPFYDTYVKYTYVRYTYVKYTYVKYTYVKYTYVRYIYVRYTTFKHNTVTHNTVTHNTVIKRKRHSKFQYNENGYLTFEYWNPNEITTF
jgi:hypothetical protein